MTISFVCLLFTFLRVSNLHAQEATNEKKELIWATPFWSGFTEPDNTGFYDQLMSSIYSESEFNLIRREIPWLRSVQNVVSGNANVTGGIPRQSNVNSILSNESIYRMEISVIGKIDTIKHVDSIHGLESLNGAWRIGFVKPWRVSTDKRFEKLTGIQVPEYLKVVRLLKANRADYYLGAKGEICAMKNKHEELSSRNYIMKTLMIEPLYMAFSMDEKGEKAKEVFDLSLRRLKKEGRYNTLLEKIACPPLDVPLGTVLSHN